MATEKFRQVMMNAADLNEFGARVELLLDTTIQLHDRGFKVGSLKLKALVRLLHNVSGRVDKMFEDLGKDLTPEERAYYKECVAEWRERG